MKSDEKRQMWEKRKAKLKERMTENREREEII